MKGKWNWTKDLLCRGASLVSLFGVLAMACHLVFPENGPSGCGGLQAEDIDADRTSQKRLYVVEDTSTGIVRVGTPGDSSTVR